MKRSILFALIAVLVTNATSLPLERLILQTVTQNQTNQTSTKNNNTIVIPTTNNTNNTTNRTLPTNKLSNQSTEAFVLISIFLVFFSVSFYIYYKAGQKPTSRVTSWYEVGGQIIKCSFDVLGKINPEEQEKFELGADAD